MLLNCSVREDSWESLGLQGQTSPSSRKSDLNIHWKDWCWNWNSNILATWCEELTHWRRSWCWEWLKAGGEGDDRGWDGCMASLTQWTLIWVNSGNWWWTRKPIVLQSIGSQRVRHDWVTALNWTELIYILGPRQREDEEEIWREVEVLWVNNKMKRGSTIRWNVRSAATRVSSHNPWSPAPTPKTNTVAASSQWPSKCHTDFFCGQP